MVTDNLNVVSPEHRMLHSQPCCKPGHIASQNQSWSLTLRPEMSFQGKLVPILPELTVFERLPSFSLYFPSISNFSSSAAANEMPESLLVREDINRKKTFSFGHCPNKGGGLPMPEFFGPLFRSAFLVNKKSLFLQKCQCIELLTVF